jgi:hypothetical protein
MSADSASRINRRIGYCDTMDRLNSMTDLGASNTLVSATSYDPANRLVSITGSVYNASRTAYGCSHGLKGLKGVERVERLKGTVRIDADE